MTTDTLPLDLDAMRRRAVLAVARNTLPSWDFSYIPAMAADVLALVDEVETLRKDRDAAFEALAKIQDLYADA